MSYILDALRRADAERERGGVPGIHAQQLPPGGLPETAHAPASRKLLWVSVGLALLLLVSLAWQWLARDSDSAASVDASRAAQGTVTPPPPVPGPAEVTPALPTSVPAAETPAPAPAPASAVAPLRKPPTAVIATRTAAAKVKPPAASASSAASSAATSRVMARSELPDDVQRNLPTLTVGGASYSQNPVNRMLIVNGQIFREGDLLAPDVALEQIRLKEAVIATKGYRYRIDY